MISHYLVGTAEQDFRDAFDRLKRGKPIHLEKGAKVTQNNVAKEADRDPTALKKSRHPPPDPGNPAVDSRRCRRGGARVVAGGAHPGNAKEEPRPQGNDRGAEGSAGCSADQAIGS
jgi:hypothetical protein